MKHIKKCPLLVLIIGTGLLFTIIAIGGRNGIYSGQEYEPYRAPILSVMFTAMNDDIYPWQMFNQRVVETASEAVETKENDLGEADRNGIVEGEQASTEGEKASAEEVMGRLIPGIVVSETEENAKWMPLPEKTAQPAVSPKQGASPSPNPSKAPKIEQNEPLERIEPLRESTYEEYINHISADIYGDAGVLRAAEYEFSKVEESYFKDALFIGDSRTVGLSEYTDLAEYADFYCETSLTVYKVMEESFRGKGTIEKALADKDYGKIYIMVGINELGRGTTEDFMEQYTQVIDRLSELEPEARIFIQGIMRVSKEKDSTDAIFNNSNINARNNAIATLADNQRIFYIDVNEVVCDEDGNLNEAYTFDQIHLLGMYNDLWKQFLMTHGV